MVRDVSIFERQRWSGDCIDRYSSATCASHGSVGAQSSDTSNSGSTETISHDAPKERFPCRTTSPTPVHYCRKDPSVVTAEGRLIDAHVRVEFTDDGHLVLTADATCKGSSIRRVARGWRSRHVEVARRLMRELLATVRVALEETILKLMGCDEVVAMTTQCSLVDSPSHLDDKRMDDKKMDDTASIHTDSSEADDAPGVQVVDIEWGGIRWNSDAMYDPEIDGAIHLQGACTLDDPEVQLRRREQRPVWSAFYTDVPSATPLAPPTTRASWRTLPRERILEEFALRAALLSSVAVNAWSNDRGAYTGDKRTCDDDTEITTLFGMRTSTALVRVRGSATLPSEGKEKE